MMLYQLPPGRKEHVLDKAWEEVWGGGGEGRRKGRGGIEEGVERRGGGEEEGEGRRGGGEEEGEGRRGGGEGEGEGRREQWWEQIKGRGKVRAGRRKQYQHPKPDHPSEYAPPHHEIITSTW